MSRGIGRERAVRKLLEAEGWVVVRAAGSLGPIDLVALRINFKPHVIEVKSDVVSPWANFRPADRRDMLEVARRAGALAYVAWWPPRRECQWIPSDDWPAVPELDQKSLSLKGDGSHNS